MEEKDRTPVVLVTGATNGIGLALAKRLLTTDYRVVVTGRPQSFSVLEDQFSVSERVLIAPLDVTDAKSREALISEVEECWGGVDILVNNAGISFRSVVEQMSHEEEMLQLETNYFGPVDLIRRVLPHMRRQKRGKIINISSVAGLMAMPTMGSYSASKFALEGSSEALWYELRPWNVQVSLLQAGFIRSDSYQRVYWSEKGKRSAEDPSEDYHIFYKRMSGFVEKLMERAWSTPESTAEKILWIMKQKNPPLRVPATLDARFFFWLRRLLPRRFYHFILYRNLPHIGEWEKAVQEIAAETKE